MLRPGEMMRVNAEDILTVIILGPLERGKPRMPGFSTWYSSSTTQGQPFCRDFSIGTPPSKKNPWVKKQVFGTSRQTYMETWRNCVVALGFRSLPPVHTRTGVGEQIETICNGSRAQRRFGGGGVGPVGPASPAPSSATSPAGCNSSFRRTRASVGISGRTSRSIFRTLVAQWRSSCREALKSPLLELVWKSWRMCSHHRVHRRNIRSH